MNVIVANLNRDKFLNLDVDIIKTISGEFTSEEIVQTFSNFFFNRMFLDITSIKDYKDINNLRKISLGLDVSKIILYISNDVTVNSESYISSLISMGFYNFAKNEDEVKYLYNNPNVYKDVAHLQKIENKEVENILSNYTQSNNDGSTRVIGIKNFTNHAGATTLTYILKKQLSKDYSVIAIEINKKDFMFLRDDDMKSCNDKNINEVIKQNQNANIILIDLNDLDMTISETICNDILYLMESSTLMINKAVILDNDCFKKLENDNVILNRSVLDKKDIARLEFESNLKFFSVLPPLDDRKDNSQILLPLLEKLGLYQKN